MQLSQKHLLSLLIAGALFIGFFVGLEYFKNSRNALGSVAIGNEYQATTTDANWGNTCKDTLVDRKTLGSVIVTMTSNAPLEIYDATTTLSHTDHATTSIALFKTTTAGLYTFDVRAKRGICVVSPSTVGTASTTITTRP